MDSATKIIVSSLYDGTNAEDILAVAMIGSTNTWSIEQETETALILREATPWYYGFWTIPLNRMLLVIPDTQTFRIIDQPEFERTFRWTKDVFLEAASDPEVIGELKEVIKAEYHAGIAALPALLLNGQTTISVPLDGAFPDTNYTYVLRWWSGSSILAQLQVLSVVKSVDSVSVTVKANGLATGAGIILVYCHRNN